MVEQTQGDGVKRDFIYGHFREDKPADMGYSKEIVHPNLDKAYYEKMEDFPLVSPNDTLLKAF